MVIQLTRARFQKIYNERHHNFFVYYIKNKTRDTKSDLNCFLYQPPGLTDLTSKDPRWIGNWWVGFLGSAGFLFLFSIILLGFPTHFQTDERMEPKMQNSLKQAKLHIFLTRLKEFLVAGKELMLNPVFVCNCLAVNIPRFVMDGAAPFFVKFLLMKYGISASDVGKAVAFAAAPGLFCKHKSYFCLCSTIAIFISMAVYG